MPAPRRKLQETFAEAHTPPTSLTSTQTIARIVKGEGNNLFLVRPPTSAEDSPNGFPQASPEESSEESPIDKSEAEPLLVELQPRFRSSIWLRRGGFVVIDTDRAALGERENKIRGEIVNVVLDEKAWRKMRYWPKEFEKAKRKEGDEVEVEVEGAGS